MNYASISILESDDQYDFSDNYDVFYSGTFIGSIRRYDIEVDAVFSKDGFFATPGPEDDGGDDFDTFGKALDYLIAENA